MSHLCLFLRVTKIMTFREIIGISLFFPRQENPVSSAGILFSSAGKFNQRLFFLLNHIFHIVPKLASQVLLNRMSDVGTRRILLFDGDGGDSV